MHNAEDRGMHGCRRPHLPIETNDKSCSEHVTARHPVIGQRHAVLVLLGAAGAGWGHLTSTLNKGACRLGRLNASNKLKNPKQMIFRRPLAVQKTCKIS